MLLNFWLEIHMRKEYTSEGDGNLPSLLFIYFFGWNLPCYFKKRKNLTSIHKVGTGDALKKSVVFRHHLRVQSLSIC